MVKILDNKSNGFNQWASNQAAAKQGDVKKNSLTSFLVWMVIFLAAWWLFSSWMAPKQDPKTAVVESAAVIEDISNVPSVNLDSKSVSAKLQGLRVSEIGLKDYTGIALLNDAGEYMEFGFNGAGTSVPSATTVWNTSTDSDGVVKMSWKSPQGVEFNRTISLSADYLITVNDTVVNKSNAPVSVSSNARIVRKVDEKKAQVGVETGGIVFANGDMDREDWRAIAKKPQSYQILNNSGFAGFTDQYWQTIVKTNAANNVDQTVRMRQQLGGLYQVDNASENYSIEPGAQLTWTTVSFAGPKDQQILKAAAPAIAGIDKTIDYGWFGFLARPFLWLLNALFGFVGNYGVAIILFTIGLRILMWPLTRKSFVNMAAMQKMSPELQRIQKLYANDKMRLQMEMMALYKTHKTSPMAGCLPMLLQIPIFFALYKALLISVPMRSAGFLWISDLAVMDPLFILPIIMGGTMWLQQHLQTATPTNSNPNDPMAQTQKVMKWMPFIFTIMFLWMPAGLVLYWTVSNMFGIGQMWLIKKTMK